MSSFSSASSSSLARVKGLFYGQAIGDSIGLCTEFMTKEDVKKHYGSDKALFRNIDKISDYHRDTWVVGDWTDDTDIFLCLVKSLIECRGYDSCCFSKHLSNWLQNGLRECGDRCGHGAGNTTSIWWGDEYNATDPERTGVRTLIYDPFRAFTNGSNGSLMRISILGSLNYSSQTQLIETVRRNSMTTHASPYCFLACVYYVILIERIIKLPSTTSLDSASFSQLCTDVLDVANHALIDYCRYLEGRIADEVNFALQDMTNPNRNELTNMSARIIECCEPFKGYDATEIMSEFKRYVVDTIDVQSLSLETQIGYVFKTVTCAVLTLKKFVSELERLNLSLCDEKDRDSIGLIFHKLISEITLEAGDADTNGCVAGALLGAYAGFVNIPSQLVDDLKFKNLLHEYYVKFLTCGLCPPNTT